MANKKSEEMSANVNIGGTKQFLQELQYSDEAWCQFHQSQNVTRKMTFVRKTLMKLTPGRKSMHEDNEQK